MITDEVVDQHLDAVLRAAGSARRYYTMEKSIADMRAAMRVAMEVGAEFFSRVPQAPSVPDGWQLVPEVPTQEMVRAGASAARAYMQEHGGNSPHVMWSTMLAAAPQPECSAYRSQALDDVLAERRRQIEVKGWTPEHDDEHANGEMALAAAAYAVSSVETGDSLQCAAMLFHRTGWAKYWFKPSSPRRDLVKAVALGLAELERKDRAERSAGDEREGCDDNL